MLDPARWARLSEPQFAFGGTGLGQRAKVGAVMDHHLRPPGATLSSIYESVFLTNTAPPIELPDREGKSYALTRANFEEHRAKLVKLIACIANRANDVGYIVCRGDAQEANLVDGALVDDAVRSKVYPHVPFELTRENVGGRVVDFIVVSSRNRPHLMTNAGGEMIIPFRGAANNITAGRHELDHMYEARQLVALRQLLARAAAPGENPVDQFLAEVDWGGLSETSDQEFVYAIVPQFLEDMPLGSLVDSKDAHAITNNIFHETIESAGVQDWFAQFGSFVTGRHDGYFEIYQPSAFEGHRIGTIRLYDIGAVIARVWILEPQIDGQKMFSFNHFTTALRGTLDFASRVYAQATFPKGDVEIRTALANAEDLGLWIVPSANPRKVLPNRDVGRRCFIPNRPIVVDPHLLQAQATEISEKIGRALKTHYGS